MVAAFAEQAATVCFEVSNEIDAFHMRARGEVRR